MSERSDRWEDLAAKLDRWWAVPDSVLTELVLRDGCCSWVFVPEAEPELTGDAPADRELAERLCAGCPVMDACLELELRASGERTTGVWGGLGEDDRRALWSVWSTRRGQDRRDAQ